MVTSRACKGHNVFLKPHFGWVMVMIQTKSGEIEKSEDGC